MAERLYRRVDTRDTNLKLSVPRTKAPTFAPRLLGLLRASLNPPPEVFYSAATIAASRLWQRDHPSLSHHQRWYSRARLPGASPFFFPSRYAQIRYFCPAFHPLGVAPLSFSFCLGGNTDGLVASLFSDAIPFDAVKRISPCGRDVISHIYRV